MRRAHLLVSAHRPFSPGAEALTRRARAAFPGGDTRASARFALYPLRIERASGCRMTDVDGHEPLSVVSNFTALPHGHARPEAAQAAKGATYAAPSAAQVELAVPLIGRAPSIEQMRFAQLPALRAA